MAIAAPLRAEPTGPAGPSSGPIQVAQVEPTALSSGAAVDPLDEIAVREVTQRTGNRVCDECHAVRGFSVRVPNLSGRGVTHRDLYVDPNALGLTAHGSKRCIACHTGIERIPHRAGVERRVDCVTCHTELAGSRETASGYRRTLARVVENIAFYMESIHSQPRENDPAHPNAGCPDCHDGHAIHPHGSEERAAFRLETPEICGRCHPDQLVEYQQSVHGVASQRFGNGEAAVCADCHTSHRISHAHQDPALLVITKSCGNCHQEQYQTYANTYHGRVNVLGYTNTAKCFDCHGGHSNRRVDDPRSPVSGDNRAKTCMRCHEGVSPGFLTFQPHGNTHDFERYPEMWLASKSMIGLLVGVFLFFWSHSLLWFYRERRERRQLKAAGLLPDPPPQPQPLAGGRTWAIRFPWGWRIAHLTFALSLMFLALTGMTVMFAGSFWARSVAGLFGSAELMGILHRSAAVIFAGVFFIHLVVVFHKLLWVERKTFRWFGPRSLLPHWRDLQDFIAMIKWFFGKGPRPVFGHWTYWEKFDYWAPFWGMVIIGFSGLVLWFPRLAGEIFPGWIFNVATIIHGEEAFLAVVFLFTVHFFNCHLRPGKFPLDIVMFIGAIPLEELKHERPLEHKRLRESGQLEQILTDPPPRAGVFAAKVLGFTLLAIGLTLLILVTTGFWQSLF